MSRNLFQNRFLIPSARANWLGYDGGEYFVTICTQNREHYFGEIVKNNNDEPEMVLTPRGQFTEEQIRNVTQHYPYAEIPLWVVMPNHVHAIVVIDGDNIPYQRRVTNVLDAHNVETRHVPTTARNSKYARLVVCGCWWYKIRRHQIRQRKQHPVRVADTFFRPHCAQPKRNERHCRIH